MSNPLPDDPTFYTSPLSGESLQAIGEIITSWAAVENALPLQVARLIAALNLEGREHFAHAAFLRAGLTLLGTPAPAALNQIENLAPSRKEEIRAAGQRIRDIKPKRDAIAHSISGATATDTVLFHGSGMSRVNMGTDKPYGVKQMKGWCNDLKSKAREIDAIVTELTGWPWKRIEEDRERWLQGHRDRGVEIRDFPRQ